MIRLRQVATSVVMNWLSVAAGIASTFFLSPYVVHKLGPTGYGVWVLATSAVGYMSFLELGLRGTITYYIAQHHARKEHDLASRSFSAVLWVRLFIGLVVVLGTLGLTAGITTLFRIPPEYHQDARWTVLLVGISFAFSMTLGLFGGVIVARGRFDLLSGANIVQTLLYAIGALLILHNGYGLVALAALQAGLYLGSAVAQVGMAKWLYPELRILFQRPKWEVLREIWNFSFYVLLIGISGQLTYYTGNFLAGALISAAAVTTYSISLRLIDYHRQLASSLSQVIMPMASSLGAIEDRENVRRLLLHGTRAALVISWPIQLALFFRGETFISLWMGREFGEASGHLLRILLLPNLFATAAGIASNITFGLGKHKPVAIWGFVESIVDVALAVWLGRIMGLPGVAWGLAIPALFTQTVFWPIFITRLVGYPLRLYLLQGMLRPALAVAPFAAACAWAERYWEPSRLDVFMLQIAALLPLYALALALVFRRELYLQWTTPDSLLRRKILQPALQMIGRSPEQAVNL